MIGQIIAVAAGGEREAGQVGLEVPVDYEGWRPGWPGLCACRPGGPPHPG